MKQKPRKPRKPSAPLPTKALEWTCTVVTGNQLMVTRHATQKKAVATLQKELDSRRRP